MKKYIFGHSEWANERDKKIMWLDTIPCSVCLTLKLNNYKVLKWTPQTFLCWTIINSFVQFWRFAKIKMKNKMNTNLWQNLTFLHKTGGVCFLFLSVYLTTNLQTVNSNQQSNRWCDFRLKQNSVLFLCNRKIPCQCPLIWL